jgi:hypothetical protein
MSAFHARAARIAIGLATVELKVGILAGALERYYRVDQPRAPQGTRIGGQWIDDTTLVAAAARCDGFSGGCQNGGSFGSSGMIRIGGKKLCWDCAIKYLGIQDLSGADQIKTLSGFDPTLRK